MGVRAVLGLTFLSTGLVLGVAFYLLDGIPQDHDKYARLSLAPREGDAPATGSVKLDLPEGEVRLNWEGDVSSFGDSRTVEDPPDDMTVTVVPAAGRKPVETEGRGGYQSIIGDTGWQSWKGVEIPEEGPYVVTIEQPSAEGGAVTVGAAFWKPGGSRMLGAVMIGLLPALVALIVAALIGIFRRR